MQSRLIEWEGDVSATYEVQYKKSTALVWSNAPGSAVTGVSITISNLDDNTNYQIRVRRICNNRITSWLYDSFLTGSGSCLAITNLATSNVTSSTANITWTASAGATGYVVQYKKNTASNWTSGPIITITGFQITGLSSAQAYQVRIVSVCSGGAQASSSNSAFTTL